MKRELNEGRTKCCKRLNQRRCFPLLMSCSLIHCQERKRDQQANQEKMKKGARDEGENQEKKDHSLDFHSKLKEDEE